MSPLSVWKWYELRGLMSSSPLHRAGAARIGRPASGCRCLLLVVGDAPEQHRVRLARVVPPEGDEVGLARCRRSWSAACRSRRRRSSRSPPRSCTCGRWPRSSCEPRTPFISRFSIHWASIVSCPEPVRPIELPPYFLTMLGDLLGDELLGLLVGHLHEDVVVEAPLGRGDVARVAGRTCPCAPGPASGGPCRSARGRSGP